MNTTVIVTCKDRIENLKLCVSSIAACIPRPFAVVVDFGSNSPIKFSEHKDWLKVVRVDRNTNLFHKARAINIGIRNVKTKFLCITDADQIFQPNFFGVLKKTLQRNPKSFVMCKSHFLITVPDNVIFSSNGNIYFKLLKLAKKSGVIPHGDGCCNGVSTAWSKNVHGYDETYIGYRAQDSDFALRAVRAGLKKTWITASTSMIHLPHARKGEYYNKQFVVVNKQKYYNTRKMNAKKIIVANKGKPWGQL